MPRYSLFRSLTPALCFAGTVALLSGCAWSGSSAPPQVAYACDDGSGLVVQFSPDAALVKNQIGENFRLPQQAAASGMAYAADGYVLRGKGEEATWTTPAGAEKTCRVLPSARNGWWPW